MCQGFSHFSDVLHHFVFAKLATSSVRVNKDLRVPGNRIRGAVTESAMTYGEDDSLAGHAHSIE